MATGNQGTTENAEWIPEIIANEAIGYLQSYLNLGATVAKDAELAPARVGQVVSIPKRGVVVAQTKNEDTDASNQQIAATEIQVTVDQHKYVRIGEEDFTRSFQIGSVLPGYAEDAVMVLAETIEQSLIDLESDFPQFDAGTGAGDALDGVVDLRQKLVENKVPQLAPMYLYAHPSFISRLLKEEAFIDPKTIPAQRAMVEGAVGRVSRFDVFEGQLAKTQGSPAIPQNFGYTRNALVLASRPLLEVPNSMGVESATVMTDAGLALRSMRFYDTGALAVVQQLDVLFGAAVNDVRQGYVLQSPSA